MLGPVLICHSKAEPSPNELCGKLTASCEGLGEYVKVIGADGEKSIHNQCLKNFPSALLLLCFKHVKDNVSDYITKNLSLKESQKNSILDDLFGAGTREGITDSESPKVFRSRIQKFYEDITTRYQDEGKQLVEYLKQHKESILEHHVSKFAVINAGICSGAIRFYNNASESVNKMLHSWMNGKHDIYKFTQEYESFITNQEEQVRERFSNNFLINFLLTV